MRMRAGPFTWELGSCPSSGQASLCPFPIGTAQHQYFKEESARSGHHVEITALIPQQHPSQAFHCREEGT